MRKNEVGMHIARAHREWNWLTGLEWRGALDANLHYLRVYKNVLIYYLFN